MSETNETDKRIQIVADLKASLSSQSGQELIQKSFYEPGEDVACTLSARLIIEEAKRLGINGVIYDLDNPEADDQHSGHTYVVLEGMNENGYPINCPIEIGIEPPKVAELRERGKDVTDELMNSPLEQLF